MLLQMSRRAHVEAALRDNEELKPLHGIFTPSSASADNPSRLSDTEQAEYLSKGSKLSTGEYNALGEYLLSTDREYRSVYSQSDGIAATQEDRFLPPTVHTRTEVLVDGRTFSIRQSHEGNSAVQYANPSNQESETGNIEAIWQLPLNHCIHTFFVVRPHQPLPPNEEQLAPFAQFHERYATRIVDSNPSNQHLILEQQHIHTHLSTYRRPAGTYGIPRETLVVCWALNRGRR